MQITNRDAQEATANASPQETEKGVETTLLELVRALSDITDNEVEILATAVHMLRSGTVRLTGSFRDAPTSTFSE
jgi:hypothetical protein